MRQQEQGTNTSSATQIEKKRLNSNLTLTFTLRRGPNSMDTRTLHTLNFVVPCGLVVSYPKICPYYFLILSGSWPLIYLYNHAIFKTNIMDS